MNLIKAIVTLPFILLMIHFSVSAQITLKKSDKNNTKKGKDSMMKIEVWSDVMCPFCYIGKRKFEHALAKFSAKDKVQLIWKSYQLDPSISDKVSKEYIPHLRAKKGWGEKQTNDILNNVTQMAASVGLEYHFEKAVVANSLKAHRLAHYAKKFGLQDSIEEELFIAHFVEGKNIGDNETLASIGESIGLNKEDILHFLNTAEMTTEVHQDINEAEQIGVTGVPFFVFNRKYAVSGAQDESVFLNTLTQSFEEWQKSNSTSSLEVADGKSCKPNGECD